MDNLVAIHFDGKQFGCAEWIDGQCKVLAADERTINRNLVSKWSHQGIRVITSSKSKITNIKSAFWNDVQIELAPAIDFSNSSSEQVMDQFNVVIELSDGDNTCSVRALNALLMRLQDSSMLPGTISLLQADAHRVVISWETLDALQIFNAQTHPNMHITAGQKEGLSIYQLFQNCVSDEGRRKLRHWFQHPINDLSELQNRQQVIETLLSAELQAHSKHIHRSLKKIINTDTIIDELKFNPTARNLLKLGNCIDAISQLHLFISENGRLFDGSRFFTRLSSALVAELNDLGRLVRRIIDSEHAQEGDIYTVREHIDSELDSRRQQYSGLSEFLDSIVLELAAEYHDVLGQAVLNIAYIPQIGFLLTLPHNVHIDGFELQFESDKTCYFKSERMRQLDSEIGDVYGELMDIQLEILQSLVFQSISLQSSLREAVSFCSDLDCYLSLAQAAKTFDLCKPELVEEPILQVDEGRHLLVEAITQQAFIQNDCNLDEKRLMILTGANSSGKTVYLKQLGIITHLSHIGSFVPAKKAKIGLVDKILSRITSNESLQQGQSAFAADLKQVQAICEQASERSLLLIDEFGKGTTQNDGMALFAGLLDYFASWAQQPRLIAITHMHEIFKRGLLQHADCFQYAHMKVVMDRSLCYLYRLEFGLSGQSYAIECARDAGLSESILEQAYEFKEELEKGTSPHELFLQTNDKSSYQAAVKLLQSFQ